MLVRRRVIYYGVTCLVLVILCVAIIESLGILIPGRMVVAPASLDGLVTISMSPDKKLTFITCASYHPTLWHRLLHTTLSGAFVVQHLTPAHNIVEHAGHAHINYQGDLLNVVFADSSRFVFTSAPKGSISPMEGTVECSVGLASDSVTGFDTHADFVASRNWSEQGRSCGLR